MFISLKLNHVVFPFKLWTGIKHQIRNEVFAKKLSIFEYSIYLIFFYWDQYISCLRNKISRQKIDKELTVVLHSYENKIIADFMFIWALLSKFWTQLDTKISN